MTEKRGTQQGDHSVFRIPPYHYIHVLDQTSNVTRIGKQLDFTWNQFLGDFKSMVGIYQKSWFRASKTVKMVVFNILKSAKIDFT